MTSRESPSPVIADSLRKEYGSFTAVEDCSFTVEEGEVFGIVGPNGAGKTTTLKMLSGLLEPTSGSAQVAGLPSTVPEMREHIGFLPEESPLYENMTGVSYLKFFADLYDVPSETASERIHQTLDALGLEHRTRKIGDMSKGMTRKVAIARSLVNDPEVLIYDEPASGLDPLTTNYVLDFTEGLRDEGKTIIFSAHNLFHVEDVCDRVAIMNNGEIVAGGPIDEIRNEYAKSEYQIVSSVNVDAAVERSPGEFVITVDSESEIEAVRQQVTNRGGEIKYVRTETDSLEDIFLRIVDGRGADE